MKVKKRPQSPQERTNPLKSLVRSGELRVAELVSNSSNLSLPEINAVVEQISQVLPAGNVPEMVLSGLARLKGRKLPRENVERDLKLLIQGMEGTFEQAAYLGLFAGPATAIWAYQNLLKLVGRNPGDAFPEGTWQFYVGYALREDTARHTNETYGFDAILAQHDIRLDKVERITSWVMAAIACLHQYNGMLANEWRERVYTCVLKELTWNLPERAYYAGLYRQWFDIRPYSRGSDATDDETYPVYRLNRFMHFLKRATSELPKHLTEEWMRRINILEANHLAAYQRQMSILTYLEPGSYGETRQPIPIERAYVGLIYQGHYYLLPACEPGTKLGTHIETILNRAVAIFANDPDEKPVSLSDLARVRRSEWPGMQEKFSESLRDSLNPLRLTPILLNFDLRPRKLPLAKLRQTERGIGDHALTLFDTDESMVFDQSHIFFDGAWGAALAEIMTNEALSWAVYLHHFPPESYMPVFPRRLEFPHEPADLSLIERTSKTTVEAAAETDIVNIQSIYLLRKLFKRRSDLIKLTVNDLLVLYRAIHAITYQPSPALVSKIEALTKNPATRQPARLALKAIAGGQQLNPSILIPVDASLCTPYERVHPMSFEVPLSQLNLVTLHQETISVLTAYEDGKDGARANYAQFDKLQRTYLVTLAGFGEVLSQAKEVAITGETASVASLKLLAHLPAPLQRLLDNYSGRFEWMNDIIKGREVFSNIGKVAHTSTLSRFLTAKDDNDQKDLAWGILTNKDDIMHITLRDFRPHVAALASVGQQQLADEVAQDYLDAYAEGLNKYIVEIHRITVASRETRLSLKDFPRNKPALSEAERVVPRTAQEDK